jgi:glycosyltransferase involved in cell wall biosynthesis
VAHFSIIIPCYNQAYFLKQCIESVLQQSYADWELVIVNDGSTDNTQQVAEDFLNDNRIKLINQNNQGLSAARNAGLKHSSGDWVQFVDSDDYLLEDCLSRINEIILKSEPLDIIHTGFQMVDKLGKPIWKKVLTESYTPLWNHVKEGGIGPPLSLIISRKLIGRIGEFDTELRSAEDWDFWLRAGKLGAMRRTIASPLVAYRYLDNSMSRSPWRMYENTEKVVNRIPLDDLRLSQAVVVDIQLTEKELQGIHKRNVLQIAGLAIMQGKISEALAFFERETVKYSLEYKPVDFALMNSFLTFRYHYSKAQIDLVLNVFRPYFADFFEQSSFDKDFSKDALAHIFERHLKNRNQIRYGIFGRVLNYLMDRKKD